MLTPTIVDKKLKEVGISADDEIAEVIAPPGDSPLEIALALVVAGKI